MKEFLNFQIRYGVMGSRDTPHFSVDLRLGTLPSFAIIFYKLHSEIIYLGKIK